MNAPPGLMNQGIVSGIQIEAMTGAMSIGKDQNHSAETLIPSNTPIRVAQGSKSAQDVVGYSPIKSVLFQENVPRPIPPIRAGLKPYLPYWIDGLSNHPDKNFVETILVYVTDGIPVGFTGPLETVINPNWPSSKSFSDKVDQFKQEYTEFGSIEGPLLAIPFGFRSFPLGAFERKRDGNVRILHDLSWPPGGSVNDHVNLRDYSVNYTTIDRAVKMCAKFEKPWLAKTDLKSAYLSCHVSPQDTHLLRFK